MSLVASFVELVQPVSWAMSASVFNRFMILLTGWIFAPRRTITGMLVAADVAGQQHHAAFHRVFSAARWSLDRISSPWPVGPTVANSDIPRAIAGRASCITLVRRARVRGGNHPTGSTRQRKTGGDSRRGALWIKVDDRVVDNHDSRVLGGT